MNSLIKDIRYGARMLLKAPGFTAVAVVSLALGIGANTAIFSLANALLLRPLGGVAEPARLVNLHRTSPDGSSFHSFSYQDYLDYRAEPGVLEDLLAYSVETYSLSEGEQSERIFGMVASGNFSSVLGVRAARGRFFTPEEDAAANPARVAVLGHDFWRRRFNSDPLVVGRAVTLNGQPFTVVGVAPEGFTGPRVALSPDVYLPIWSSVHTRAGAGEWLQSRTGGSLEMLGRLAPGVGVRAAQAALGRVAARLTEQYPDSHRGHGLEVRPTRTGLGQFEAPVAGFMAVLMAVVGFVLLIACANVAGMSLARATSRRREIAIRLALGARRRRVVRQLLTESVMLYMAAGVAGLLLAMWLTSLLLAFKPATPFALELDLGVDSRVLLFTLGVSILTGLLFGLAPALQASQPEVSSALKDESGGGTPRRRLVSAFVAGQVAVSLVLLVTTGLFLRSMQNARAMSPGFDPEGVEVVGFDLRIQGYEEDRGRRFYEELLARTRGLPGARGAGLARMIPLDGGNMETGINVEGHEPPAGRRSFATDYNVVTPGYFETVGVPLRRGRDFTEADREGAPRVAVVNEAMARRYWPGAEAVGQRFRIGHGEDALTFEVVGVAADSKYRTLGEDPREYFYLPFAQNYSPQMTLHMRGAGGGGLLAAVSREVARMDRSVPLLDAMPMSEAISFSLLPIRLAAWVAGLLGLTGLLLAAVGIFGVVSYVVAQRTRELGIRIALGAQTGDVLRLVVGHGLKLALAGVAAGLVGAFALTRLLAGLLYGVSATDAATFLGVSLVLLAVALLACYVPARRATKIDPMEALRYE